MIKTVFIDIDGTLLDFNAAVEYSINSASRVHGVKLPGNILEIFHPINNDLWKRIEKGEIDIKILRKIRWNTIFEKVGVNYDGEKFEETFYTNISESAIPIKNSHSILKYLSEKYTLCASTNAVTNQQIKRLKSCCMYDYFDHLFTSEMFGASKPSKEFFDGCFERLGNPSPDTVAIIGDSLRADIIGGKSYGLTTILFDELRNKCESSPYVDYIVDDLEKIKEIL